MKPTGAVGFGETHELQPDGSYKLVKITRIQCAICGEFGWREPDAEWQRRHTHRETITVESSNSLLDSSRKSS